MLVEDDFQGGPEIGFVPPFAERIESVQNPTTSATKRDEILRLSRLVDFIA